MSSGGLRQNLLLIEAVEKHVRGVYKLRLVRQHADFLHHHLHQAQAQVLVCQQNEAFALQQLNVPAPTKLIMNPSPSTPPWHLEKISNLAVYQDIEDRLAKDMAPFRAAEKAPRQAYRQAVEASKKAKFAEKQITLELLINESKLAVLTSQDLDRENAKWQRTVLKWLIFVNECFADRVDMDGFPAPPEAACRGDCQNDGNRKLHICDCSIKAAFIYIDGLDLGYDLRSERRRWHPGLFMACAIEERKKFCGKAEEVFKIVDALWQRQRCGLGVE